MKGQFFIISTVIMITAMILITNYLYDYGKIDLTQIEQMQELNYIQDIEKVMLNTVTYSCNEGSSDVILLDNLKLAKKNLEKQFLEKGIDLDIQYTATPTCPTVAFSFDLDSSDFHIEYTFSS